VGLRGKETVEPDLIQRRKQTRVFALDSRPQFVCLSSFLSPRQGAGVDQRGNERLQALSGRVTCSAFPVLDGARAHTNAARQFALRQARARASTQQQALERLNCRRMGVRPDHVHVLARQSIRGCFTKQTTSATALLCDRGESRLSASARHVVDAARSLLALLALRKCNFAREAMLDWIAARRVLPNAEDDPLPAVPVSAWDRLSRRAQVLQGAEQWLARRSPLPRPPARRQQHWTSSRQTAHWCARTSKACAPPPARN
jgi:hypothetical protein